MPPATTDTAFEQTFADLAYAVLQDRAPVLIDHLLGFQVLDASDDQTQASGMFGAKIGKEWIYIPVFFNNGELKSGMIYLKDQDLFVPLQENWIQYILHNRPYELGGSTDTTLGELARSGANLNTFNSSPNQLGKWSSAPDFTINKPRPSAAGGAFNRVVIAGWHSNSRQDWAEEGQGIFKSAAFRADSAPALKRLDLIEFLKAAGAKAFLPLARRLKQDAKLAAAVDRFYPIQKLAEAASELTIPAKITLDPEPAGVRILTFRELDPFENVVGVTDADRARLMRGEVVIKDNRDNTSRVYRAQLTQHITQPTSPGVYNLLTRDGEMVEIFALPSSGVCKLSGCLGSDSYFGSKTRPVEALLVATDGKGYYENDVSRTFVSPVVDGLSSSKQFQALPDVSSVTPGSCYVICLADGRALEPVKVIKKTQGGDGTTLIGVSRYLHDSSDDPQATLMVSDRFTRLKKMDREVLVPAEARAIKLTPRTETSGYKDYGYLRPGNAAMIDQFLLDGGATPIKLYSSGTEYSFTAGDVKTAGAKGRLDMIKSLVVEYGMKGEDALTLMKEADTKQVTKGWIVFPEGYPRISFKKQASPFLTDGADYSAPMLQIPSDTGYDGLMSMPVQTGEAASMPVPGMTAATQSNAQLYNPNPATDNNPYQVINQAASTGQKEVFDTAVVGALVNTSDSDNLVDKYLGDLTLGMDRVGRIYFLFLSHQDDFKDRYGQSDLIELEDGLRDNFKGLGDLILFLKEKRVGLSSDPTFNSLKRQEQ